MKLLKLVGILLFKGLSFVHCFDYLRLFRSAKTRFVVSAILLFIPPAIFVGLWASLECQELRPFNDISTGGETIEVKNADEAQQTIGQIQALASSLYDFEQSQPQSGNTISQMIDAAEGQSKDKGALLFRDELSKKFTESLGVFALLPYKTVCLINATVVKVNGEVTKPLLPGGALSINQDEGGYDFYALPGKSDCKDVYINIFKNSTSTLENNFVVSAVMSYLKNAKGEAVGPFKITFATTSLIYSPSRVTIGLSWWIIIIGYFVTLLAWSLAFFQVVKIKNYLVD